MARRRLERAAAVVTGHSRGLGAGIAEHLLARGVRVLGVARRGNPDLARRYGETLSEVSLDLADPAGLLDWLRGGALERFLDGAEPALLVNNAGIVQPTGALETQDIAVVSRAVALNVAAPLVLSAAFAQATRGARDRRILHVSSGAGTNPYAGWSVYGASKAALDHHARAVALDRSPGLRIASVAPGVIDTEMQAQMRAMSDDIFPARQRFVELEREGRLTSPDRAGGALVELLLSDAFGGEPVADLRHPVPR